MTDNPFTRWASMSDTTITQHIGSFVRHQRIEQNRTQTALAQAAGISRSTLSLLERGETVTIATLIQVLRVLDQLQVMDVFTVERNISPLLMLKSQKAQRKRVSGQGQDNKEPSKW